MVYKGPAHIVDFFYEVGVQPERTPVKMHSVDPFILLLSSGHSRKDVDFMPFSFKGGCKFTYMDSDTAYRYGM